MYIECALCMGFGSCDCSSSLSLYVSMFVCVALREKNKCESPIYIQAYPLDDQLRVEINSKRCPSGALSSSECLYGCFLSVTVWDQLEIKSKRSKKKWKMSKQKSGTNNECIDRLSLLLVTRISLDARVHYYEEYEILGERPLLRRRTLNVRIYISS